jgi:ADP-heptose:LPS heptosyltransferase
LKRILLSRTDSIGDVVLTLPVAGALKEQHPDNTIIFLGRDYTKPVIELSEYIDEFYSWDEIKELAESEQIKAFMKINADAIIHIFPNREIAKISKKAKVRMRVGTTNRLYHWRYCNFMMKLSRRNSPYHEAQLNLGLLKPFGIKHAFSLDDIPRYYGLKKIKPIGNELGKQISSTRFNLIVHPKSKGSSREWGMKNYSRFIELIHKEGFHVFVTGTEQESEAIRSTINFKNYDNVTDLTGKLSLDELISFISACDGMISGSTGPLHIAAALGKLAIGLYPPIRPMHPGRWAPVGNLSDYIVRDINCSKCRRSCRCECLESITPEEVRDKVISEL